jgi:hypothetical protein
MFRVLVSNSYNIYIKHAAYVVFGAPLVVDCLNTLLRSMLFLDTYRLSEKWDAENLEDTTPAAWLNLIQNRSSPRFDILPNVHYHSKSRHRRRHPLLHRRKSTIPRLHVKADHPVLVKDGGTVPEHDSCHQRSIQQELLSVVAARIVSLRARGDGR